MEKKNLFYENRKKAGNASFLLAIVILTVGCWNVYSWYEVMAPLGTLISFVCLGVTLLCYVDLRTLLRDKMFILMVAGDIVTFIHLIIIKSGMGAFLTAADLMLVLYLMDKIKLPKKISYGLIAYLGFYFFYWTVDVKGYFKGYNTNYGGLVLITGFIFAIMGMFLIRDYLQSKGKKILVYVLYAVLLFVIALGYNIIAWYRARCALLGYLIFIILVLCPKGMWKNKVLYGLLRWGLTIGAIVISYVYVYLGQSGINIEIFYKSIMSGREEIWAELWVAFFNSPFMGIGSSYQMRLSWMDKMFEVHNGLLDILFVHGISVFVIVMIMLQTRLKKLNLSAIQSMPQKCALAGLFAVLASSFLENFFIVPPFLLCFLLMGAFSVNLDAASSKVSG